jgi:hypothetical protein
LKPGGALVFQLPSRPRPGLKGLLRRILAVPRLQPILNTYRRLWHGRPADMEMYGIPRDEVIAELEAAGGKVVDVAGCGSAGPTWSSFRYLVRKTGDGAIGRANAAKGSDGATGRTDPAGSSDGAIGA